MLAAEYGFDGWAAFKAEVLDRRRDVEWAAQAAREAIAEDRVEDLRRLLKQHPELKSWRDPDRNDEGLLQATTSYANFPGAENEEFWNRPRCAAVLLDAGAPMDPRVVLRVMTTGAHGMLALFAEHDALPDNLRVRAARGDTERVRAAFAPDGSLRDEARPAPELRQGYPNAEEDWPEASDDLEVVADAFLYACRLGHADIAAFLFERCSALDEDLERRVRADGGAAPFVRFLLDATPEVTRRVPARGHARIPGSV